MHITPVSIGVRMTGWHCLPTDLGTRVVAYLLLGSCGHHCISVGFAVVRHPAKWLLHVERSQGKAGQAVSSCTSRPWLQGC